MVEVSRNVNIVNLLLDKKLKSMDMKDNQERRVSGNMATWLLDKTPEVAEKRDESHFIIIAQRLVFVCSR